MTLKNICKKIINIGTVPVMPGENCEISEEYAELPAIKAYEKMGLITLVPEVKPVVKQEVVNEESTKEAVKTEDDAEAAKKLAEEKAAKRAAAKAAREAAKKAAAEKTE